MDAIVEKLRAEASKVDDAGRIKLLQSLRDLQLSIETPSDLLYRFAGLVSSFLTIMLERGFNTKTITQQLEIAAARLAQDLGLFQILASSAPTPLSTQDLASKTGAAPVLTSKSRTHTNTHPKATNPILIPTQGASLATSPQSA